MKREFLIILVVAVCFMAVYILSFSLPYGNILTTITGGVSPTEGYLAEYNFLGGYAQSIKCTSQSKGILKEPNAILIDTLSNTRLVGDVKLRVYLLVTCGDAVGKKWRVKVNDNIVYESEECFSDWHYVDVQFPSDYLHQQSNEVSLECDPTSSGSFYISMGKKSEGNTEFFKTVYSLK
jgi:hypothetical protein